MRLHANRMEDAPSFGSAMPSDETPGIGEIAREMKELREIAVSGQHLLVFEAAARHVSFKGAAGELGVTQPAVSRSVRQLEAALGVELFVRGHRSVALTEAAQDLYAAVRGGYERIYQVARRLRHATGGSVTVACDHADWRWYAAPRLENLQETHPDLTLRVRMTRTHPELASLGPEGAVLGIRSGERPPPECEGAEIGDEVVYPVAAPQLARTLGGGDDPEALMRARLLHSEEGGFPTVTWEAFFGALGLRYRDDGTGLRFSHYHPTLEAALAGQGVALGWAHQSDALVAQGLLARIGTGEHRTGRRYRVVWPARIPLSGPAQAVRDALLARRDPGA